MPVDRPTFSESWYRVAELKPRLRGSVQIHRQHFRGQVWHVLQDPSNNQFFRLNEAAYRFVALLDGRRSVADAWKICNEQLGDNAPTQGEAIQLMGQLYGSNLLQAELPPDSQGLLDRYRKRVAREIRGYLTNLLFIRLPIFDPDRLLDAWVGIVGKIFTPIGGILWAILIAVGAYFALSNYSDLASQFDGMLSQENLAKNLLAMYGSFAFIKVIHEFGHAFACKKFGRQTGSGGEVHVMGIMMLVFTPVPYVDASSSWAFRHKWHRVIVGAAGMIIELAVAAIAAIVWANTGKSNIVHDLAYNVVFIGSVSTLLFNGNPLLRYDGYYILSDVLEIPNLYQRSKDYIYYLVKKYVWGVRQARSSAHTPGERAWFVGYGIASAIYRTIVVLAILLFISEKLFILGAILALAAAVAWLLVPIGKFVHYLLTNNELARVRGRAIGTVLAALVLLVGLIGLVSFPDRVRVESVSEPVQMRVIYTRGDGFVDRTLPTNTTVYAGDTELVRSLNDELVRNIEVANAERDRMKVLMEQARSEGKQADVSFCERAIGWLDESIARKQRDLKDLTLVAPIDGQWVSPQADRIAGVYLPRGQKIGMVVSPRLMVRAVAPQDAAPRLMREAVSRGQCVAQMRVEGHPEVRLHGKVTRMSPAGKLNLPSAALGYSAGGMMPLDPNDRQSIKAQEEFFELVIELDPKDMAKLQVGQRLMVRIDLPAKPLAVQWIRKLQQLVQGKMKL